MRKIAFKFALLAVTMLLFVSTSFNIRGVDAESSDANYSIERVDRTITVLRNGYVLMNETIRIVGKTTSVGTTLERFLVGYPYKYGPHVVRYMAYDEADSFHVRPNVPLANRSGFYAMEIIFSQSLDISNGTTHVFTISSVLSNNLLSAQAAANFTEYTLDFPAYPSFTKAVSFCSASIVLPQDAVYVSGTVEGFTYSKENLTEFSYSPANVTFSLTGNEIQPVDISMSEREVKISEFGGIEVSDTYRVLNKGGDMNSIDVILLPSSSSVAAIDQFGRKMTTPSQIDKATNRYRISFKSTLESGGSTIFTVTYSLPAEGYISQNSDGDFDFAITLFSDMDYYVKLAIAKFVLPEGARILSFEKVLSDDAYSISRGVFQETLTVTKQSVFSIDQAVFGFAYEYNPLWASFRPTLWIWALVIVGCVFGVVWTRPKAPTPIAMPAVAARLRPEHIRSFVDSYGEMEKANLELASLETRAQKGKIPRRRYKVQKVTLETRLSSLSRRLAESKEKLRAAGGQYADLMRQLEIAETEINEADANIKSIESRHDRGDLSLEAYRELLSGYRRRKEKAEATIDGTLLRLREEIR